MSEPPLAGGCLCGAVRFEVTAAPAEAGYCHCTRCQGRTGSGFSAQARIPPGSFRLLAGGEHVETWWPESGFGKAFCRRCGAHLFSRPPDSWEHVAVRMSAFDADPGVRPSFRQFTAYAAPWEPIPEDGLPRHPESAYGGRGTLQERERRTHGS